MATFHVSRAGTTLGTFSEEEVREGLRSGKFVGSDLGWREGMAQWQALAQFSEFATPEGAPPSPPQLIPVPPVVVARSGLPWDERQSRGIFAAFSETLMLVLTRPGEAFTRMKREGGLAEPLIYGLIGSCAGFIVYWFFMMILPMGSLAGQRHNPLAHLFGFGAMSILFLIFSPLVFAVGLFVNAAILHLCLMIVGGANHSFETTFRVLCFSSGSLGPIIMVPFCGGIVAAVWGIVLHCIGLARAHETDTGRAVVAVFLPLIVCCGAGFLIAMLFGGLGAMLSQHGH